MSQLGLSFDKEDVTVALGYGEASPLQVAAAYAAFTNGGRRATPYFIERIENAAGKLVLGTQRAAAAEPAMSPETARIMNALLVQAVKQGHAAGMDGVSPLTAGASAATDDLQNSWSVGVLPSLTTAVWLGAETGQARLGADEAATADLAEHVFTQFLRAAPQHYVNSPISGINRAKASKL
jgi:penicillin-binding protein 1A